MESKVEKYVKINFNVEEIKTFNSILDTLTTIDELYENEEVEKIYLEENNIPIEHHLITDTIANLETMLGIFY